MNMRYESVEKVITRHIGLGQHTSIHSSRGYMGIIDGVVEVTGIMDGHDIPDVVESWVDTFGRLENLEDEPRFLTDVENEILEYRNGKWVEYKYISYDYGSDKPNPDTQYLPLFLFISHTSWL